MRPILTALVTLLVASGAAAQHESPYADLADREIKALSRQDVDALLAGEGMGMALPAELNGYPGPKHVLELESELELSPTQITGIRAIFDAMAIEARALGERIVTLERDLDGAFADGSITTDRLDSVLGEIAEARGRLRFAHLSAHLAVTPLLTEQQRMRYRHARGYGAHH